MIQYWQKEQNTESEQGIYRNLIYDKGWHSVTMKGWKTGSLYEEK